MADDVIGIRVGVDDDASGPLRDLTQAAGNAALALEQLTQQERDAAKAAGAGAKGTKQATDATKDQGKALTDADKAMGRYLDKAGRLREANGKYAKTGKQAEQATRGQGDAHEQAARQAEQQAKAVLLADRTIGTAMGHITNAADRMERDWRVAFGRTERHVGVIAEALDRARPRVVQAASELGEHAGESFTQAYEKAVSGMDTTMGKLGVAGGAAGTGLAWIDQNAASARAAASLGDVDPEELKEAAREVYAQGYGGAFEDVTMAQRGMLSSHPDLELGSAELEDVTKDSLNMAATWNLDPETLSRDTSAMTQYGLVESAGEATDLLAQAMTQTPLGTQDELTDAVEEYSKFFASLGMSGADMMDILTAYAPGGQYAVDKAADALKEFDVRMASNDTNMGKAYETLGVNRDEVANRYLSGDSNAVLGETVDQLLAIEDAAKRAEVAQQVFGTPLEDLGASEIDEFLRTLDKAPGTLGEVAGATDRLDATLDGSGRTWQDVQNTALTSLAKLGDAAAPVLVPLLEMLGDLAWILGPVAGLLMGAWVAFRAYRVVTGVTGFLSSAGIGLGGLSAGAGSATWSLKGLWLALRANPLGLAVTLLYGAASAFAWLYDNVEPVKVVVDELVDVFTRVDDKLRDVGQSIEDLVRDKFPQLQGPMDNMEANLAGIDGGSWQQAIDGTSVGGNPLFSYLQDQTGLGDMVDKVTPWRTKGEARAMGGTVGTSWGALPGYSPGVDNLMFTTSVPGVPYLALGGGEHIMRPEVDRVAGGFLGALNHAAATHGTTGVRQVLSQPVLHRASGGTVGARPGGGGAGVAVATAPPVQVHNAYHITIAGDILNPRQKAQALRRELERVETERQRRNYGGR